MSFNIAGDIMDLTSAVTITVDITQMGPRQQSAFRTMVRTGIINSATAPGRLALIARKMHGAPYVQIARYGTLRWGNVRKVDDGFFDAVAAIAVANELIKDEARQGYYGYRSKDANQKLHEAAKSREREGELYYSTNNTRAKKILSNVKFLHDTPIDIPDVWSFDAREHVRLL